MPLQQFRHDNLESLKLLHIISIEDAIVFNDQFV